MKKAMPSLDVVLLMNYSQLVAVQNEAGLQLDKTAAEHRIEQVMQAAEASVGVVKQVQIPQLEYRWLLRTHLQF